MLMRSEKVDDLTITLEIIDKQYFFKKIKQNGEIVIQGESRNKRKAIANYERWISEAKMMREVT